MTRVEIFDSRLDGRWLVSVSGEVDIATAPVVRERLSSILRREAGDVLLDLDGVEFIDSTGVQALLSVRREAERRERPLRLICAEGQVLKVLGLLQLTDFFDLHATRESALTAGAPAHGLLSPRTEAATR